MIRPAAAALVLTSSLVAMGCGYSEEQYRAQLDRYAQLEKDSAAKQAELEKQLQAERSRWEQLSSAIARIMTGPRESQS